MTRRRVVPLPYDPPPPTEEELREMIATLNEESEPGYDSTVKKPPFTLKERPIVCCVLFARLIVGQIPTLEMESKICSLLLREIRAGRWPSWKIETEAIKSAIFGICRESLSPTRREAAEQLCYDWLLRTTVGPSLG